MGRHQEKQALLTWLIIYFDISLGRLGLFLEPKENKHVEVLFNKQYAVEAMEVFK